MTSENTVAGKAHVSLSLSATLAYMAALLGCLAEITRREDGPFLAYAAPLGAIAVALVELGCVHADDEDREQGDDSNSNNEEHAND